MATREPIYAALWALVSGDARAQASFVTMSRYTRHFDEVGGQEMPALFLMEKAENWQMVGRGVPPKRTLECQFLVYTNTGDPLALRSPVINTLMDILDDVIAKPPNPANVQTLGGLVNHVYIEGRVEIAEAFLQAKSIFVVPITMLIP